MYGLKTGQQPNASVCLFGDEFGECWIMRFMLGDGGEYLMVSDNKTLYSYFFDLNHVVSMVLMIVFSCT
jgi:hypothetical protein